MTATDGTRALGVRRNWLVARLGRLDAALDTVVSFRALALLRMAAGPIVLVHLEPFLNLARDGIAYSDIFYQPYFSMLPEVPGALYIAMLWAAVGTAMLMSVGLATRIAASYTAFFVGYNLYLSKTHFSHNRAFLLILLIALAALPVGRVLSVDAWLRRRRGRPFAPAVGGQWLLYLLRFEVASVYVASGLSKGLDPDWWGGLVTRIRVEDWFQVALDAGVPQAVMDVVVTSGFHTWFAKIAVLTELFIGLGLLWPRLRLAAIWVAVPFHLSIAIVASVQTFSYATLAALVIWVTPTTRDRKVILRGDARSTRLIAWSLRRLDWLARFEVAHDDEPGDAITLEDRSRDGGPVVRTGSAAVRMILSRLPVTFWFVAPWNLVGLRSVWDRRLAGVFGPSTDIDPAY